MKTKLISLIIALLTFSTLSARTMTLNERMNSMLMRGEYRKAIDTCRLLLISDSLNPEVHFDLGIAYQYILEDDSSLSCFYRAANLDPENKAYSFMLAKGYYGKGKFRLAEPLLKKLSSADSLNWAYAHYLSGIYVQTYRYDEAIGLYDKFLKADTANSFYIDKIAWAFLKKGDYNKATDLYNKSLAINTKDITAIKNLSWLYSLSMNADTAVKLLSRGIAIDSSDTDLFLRRATLYYSMHYTKRALDDYLVVLASGDSTKTYLKRIGIGYCNNLQPAEAIQFLLKAHKKDTTDYETCSYLGQAYYNLEDMKNSIYYYDKVIRILIPATVQLGLTYILSGESQKRSRLYNEAIESYMQAMKLKPDPNLYLITANLYDEKLNDRQKAISYYKKFLDNVKNAKMEFSPEYIETVRKRMEFLKMKPEKEQKPDSKL